jgi:Na+-driven multidrug efflux pump
MGFVILSLGIPRLYRLTNTYWIGQIDYSALAIAEQYEFIGIIIEIINETIPFGILALVSQNYRNHVSVTRYLSTGVILQLVLSVSLAVAIFANMTNFVDFIGTAPELVAQTKSYLGIRAIALPFYSLGLLLVLGLKSMDRAKQALLVVLSYVIVNMLLDLFLVSNLSFSLQLGLKGVAWGYLVSNVVYCLIAAGVCLWTLRVRREVVKRAELRSRSVQIFRIGGWTGLDSVVRNVFYFFSLQVLNFMGPNQYAGFQLFQMLMWTALIPVIAIAEGTAIRVGNYFKDENAYYQTKRLLMTSSTLAFLWIGAFGILGLLAIDALGFFFNPNPEIVKYSSIMFYWQIIPYILFAVAMNLRGLFFGTGKTYFILLISLVNNLFVIVPFLLLINTATIPQTYESVMLMFVTVDALDIVITIVCVRYLLKRLLRGRIGLPSEVILVTGTE